MFFIVEFCLYRRGFRCSLSCWWPWRSWTTPSNSPLIRSKLLCTLVVAHFHQQMRFLVDCWQVVFLLQNLLANFHCFPVFLLFVETRDDVHHYGELELSLDSFQSAFGLILQVQANHAFQVEFDGIIKVTIPVQLIGPKSLDRNPLVLLIPIEALNGLENMGVLVLAADGRFYLVVLHLLCLIIGVEFGDFELTLINIFF